MPTIGQRFGEHVLQDRVGIGAFGEVWRARHHARPDRAVAVKIPAGLAHAHGVGVVHGDVKPEDVLVSRRFGGRRRRAWGALTTTLSVAVAAAVAVLPLTAFNIGRAAEQKGSTLGTTDRAKLPVPTASPATAPASPDRPHDGGAGRPVLSGNRTRTDDAEARAIAGEIADRYPSAITPEGTLELVAAHDAAAMGVNFGKPTPMAGAYSAAPVLGRGGSIMLARVYEPWPAGKYLVVYRVQSRRDLAGQSRVCFLDVCVKAVTFASQRPPGEAFAPNAWRAIPVAVEIDAPTTLEYRFWPENREFAVDRVYVFHVVE